MSIRKHIPNTITCLSLLSGCVASVMALHGNLLSALIWIIIAAVFDFCDGFAARLLKAYSPMGKELDSLSDMVSFGFAPGMVVYWLLGEASTALPFGSLNTYIPYLAFVNRLSDLFFTMARYDMFRQGNAEERWQSFLYKRKNKS